MLDQICAHLNNWFCDPGDVVSGTWTISNGEIDLTGIVVTGQYYRIVGSTLNDGVYLHPATDLHDESFTGQIWPMKVPKDLRDLATEIAAWQQQYGKAMASPYQSESVPGLWSYSKQATAGTGGGASAWQAVFASRLNRWRKLKWA